MDSGVEINERFARATSSIPALFIALAASPPLPKRITASLKGKAGVYALFEDRRPVHVGRTRNLHSRLRGHVTRSHYSATFAFKRTRQILNLHRTYKTKGSRAALLRDDIFLPEFLRQIELVKGMEVRFIEVADPIAQYLLELYAHLEWRLPLDEFETH